MPVIMRFSERELPESQKAVPNVISLRRPCPSQGLLERAVTSDEEERQKVLAPSHMLERIADPTGPSISRDPGLFSARIVRIPFVECVDGTGAVHVSWHGSRAFVGRERWQ